MDQTCCDLRWRCSDRDGEAIVPVIQGSLQSGDACDQHESGRCQGCGCLCPQCSARRLEGRAAARPRSGPTTIVVGDAARGQAYFDPKCSVLPLGHGDLRGIATKYPDAKILQKHGLSGGGRPGRGVPGLHLSDGRDGDRHAACRRASGGRHE